MAEIILRAEHISKAFIGVQALDDVSVEIHKGEIHCLVGENGSGKSTFVKTASGVYTSDAVSYTHLDVYKRQAYRPMDIWKSRPNGATSIRW